MRQILSKQQILLQLVQKYNCDWENLFKAWNSLYVFLERRIQYEEPDIQHSHILRTFKTWWNESDFPLEQVLVLKFNKGDVYAMMRSVCSYIINKEFEQNRFETVNRPKYHGGDVDTSIPAHPNQAVPETRPASLSKEVCFSILARSHDRKWDNFSNAWNALEQYIEPRLNRRVSKLPSDERLEKWRHRPNYPFELVLVLNLSKEEVNMLMRCVCNHIASIKVEPEQASDETALSQIKRARDDDLSNDDVETKPTPEPTRKRARSDPQRKALPVTTKIYFMEEGNEDSRSGILVTLLSNAKPENGEIDINTLRYGNVTRHLAKRNDFEKHKHRIFYYDLENRNVRINVDTVASFRAAVEEMFTYRRSEPQIEFCFRSKEGLASNSDNAPVTPVSAPRFQRPSGDFYRPQYWYG